MESVAAAAPRLGESDEEPAALARRSRSLSAPGVARRRPQPARRPAAPHRPRPAPPRLSRPHRQRAEVRHGRIIPQKLIAGRRFKKKTFYCVVFNALAFFTFFNVFLIFQTFLKNVGKVQSGKQINKKHFQDNSNEIYL